LRCQARGPRIKSRESGWTASSGKAPRPANATYMELTKLDPADTGLTDMKFASFSNSSAFQGLYPSVPPCHRGTWRLWASLIRTQCGHQLQMSSKHRHAHPQIHIYGMVQCGTVQYRCIKSKAEPGFHALRVHFVDTFALDSAAIDAWPTCHSTQAGYAATSAICGRSMTSQHPAH
jgi:hypothetical protein